MNLRKLIFNLFGSNKEDSSKEENPTWISKLMKKKLTIKGESLIGEKIDITGIVVDIEREETCFVLILDSGLKFFVSKESYERTQGVFSLMGSDNDIVPKVCIELSIAS